MSETLANLSMLASQNQLWAYFIIYISTIFLGNIPAFASFWLVLHGSFGPWGVPLLVLTLFLSYASGDLLWYGLGRALRGTLLGNFIKKRFAPQQEKIEEKLNENSRGLIFVSKFLYASSSPVIFSVGWAKIDFKKFFTTSLLSIMVWLPILTAVSYGLISGLTPLRAVSIFKQFGIVFLVGLALFFIVEYALAGVLKKLFILLRRIPRL